MILLGQEGNEEGREEAQVLNGWAQARTAIIGLTATIGLLIPAVDAVRDLIIHIEQIEEHLRYADSKRDEIKEDVLWSKLSKGGKPSSLACSSFSPESLEPSLLDTRTDRKSVV